MSPLPCSFTLFPHLAVELRVLIWQHACQISRVVEVRYIPHEQRCTSRSRPPAVLHVSRESRYEALHMYKLCFSTPVAESHIYFNPTIDVLYRPRYRDMGYDETLRNFKSYLARPSELDNLRQLALDHVDAEAKRPWEAYNKTVCIRDFLRLEVVTLVLSSEPANAWREEAQEIMTCDFEFVDPMESSKLILQILVDFEETFAQEHHYGKHLQGLESRAAPPALRVMAKSINGLRC